MEPNIGVVILAAGKGTRMKSDKAKVLHEICGQPMIEYVVRTAQAIAGENIVVVVGHQAAAVQERVTALGSTLFALQEEQLGTGHAVLCAMPKLPDSVEQVVILCGDVPLIRTSTIQRLIDNHSENNRDISVLTVKVDNPKGYGRIVLDGEERLTAIVEEADADTLQKQIDNINTGIYVVDKKYLSTALPRLRSDNAQNEIYLTDIVKLGYHDGKNMGAVMGHDSNEIIGVNSPVELEAAENILKSRQI